ncbi:guanine deaminase [Qingshengfaniella alkalisoli]|uniref:Guanine deaminase n=1 Tax=Qingshengfaniella alkalisoli TaxID=2599296 RepID=A0A5B8J4N4_9RHOB|nr:guanine deaminase [Qingshengfaniella alkalisoli]QDY71658.1 guanine deaminase [Qingshengfaniella alkalisoli]
MTETLLRGRLLSFRDVPQGADDTDSYLYIEDGGVLMRDGVIVASGDFGQIHAQAALSTAVVDHRPNLILPGFIDTHIHFPQAQVIASWGAKLLDWLNTYTFPMEAEFSDASHAKRIASLFYDELVKHGTTTAVAFCSVHPESVDAYFDEAEKRNMRMIGGKVMMDRNAPDGLLDTPQTGYDQSLSLIEKWHGQGRALYAISPRFAITSTPEQLEMSQALIEAYPDCYIQTHLSENRDEIDFTLSLYPEASDYLNVYERYGLLGPRSLFGHSIYLNERERAAMAETGSVAVFCPTSNLFLGSGLYDKATFDGAGVRTAIATDVGGGTNYSMLRTLDEGYKVLQLSNQALDPLMSFYWITLGNARALQLDDKIGTLDAGTEADIVVLNCRSSSAMALRAERVTTLREELFLLQTLGDDRSIVETYVSGTPQLGAALVTTGLAPRVAEPA